MRITTFPQSATLATLQHHHGSGLEEASYTWHPLDLCSGANKHGGMSSLKFSSGLGGEVSLGYVVERLEEFL